MRTQKCKKCGAERVMEILECPICKYGYSQEHEPQYKLKGSQSEADKLIKQLKCQ